MGLDWVTPDKLDDGVIERHQPFVCQSRAHHSSDTTVSTCFPSAQHLFSHSLIGSFQFAQHFLSHSLLGRYRGIM